MFVGTEEPRMTAASCTCLNAREERGPLGPKGERSQDRRVRTRGSVEIGLNVTTISESFPLKAFFTINHLYLDYKQSVKI